MNTLKWGLYGLLIVFLFTLSGCGQVSNLTTGADESNTVITSSRLFSANQAWLFTKETATLSYTNTTEDSVTLTFIRTPIAITLSYQLPGDPQTYSQDFGVLNALTTYTLAPGQIQSWQTDRLPEQAIAVVLTLYMMVENQVVTEDIPLN